ncbi:MAG: hypothetical protein KIC67_14840 [Clostridium butyricum]|nr:hypothetical protein [Clostridium butyricum]
MIKELIKRLEPWDITEEDIRIDTFKKCIADNTYKRGVSLELKEYEITVSSYSEKSQKGNLKRCFEIMETILINYML